MAITIDGLQLYTGSESGVSVDAELETTQPQGQDSDEALLVDLKAVETMSVSGEATGIRISGESGYSSDPVDALAEWIQDFESLASDEQGAGWSLTDDERNRTTTVTVTDLSWTVSAGAPAVARWDISLSRGEAVMQSASRSPTSQTPNANETLGADNLGTITEKRTSRRVDIETVPIALADTSDTVIVPQSGVVQQFVISGRKGGTTSELRTFDDNLRANTGGSGDTTLTYQTGIPGTSHEVKVADYSSTYQAGETATLEYELTLFEGLSI